MCWICFAEREAKLNDRIFVSSKRTTHLTVPISDFRERIPSSEWHCQVNITRTRHPFRRIFQSRSKSPFFMQSYLILSATTIKMISLKIFPHLWQHWPLTLSLSSNCLHLDTNWHPRRTASKLFQRLLQLSNRVDRMPFTFPLCTTRKANANMCWLFSSNVYKIFYKHLSAKTGSFLHLIC